MRAPVASAFRWTKVHGLQMTFATVTLTGLLICFFSPDRLTSLTRAAAARNLYFLAQFRQRLHPGISVSLGYFFSSQFPVLSLLVAYRLVIPRRLELRFAALVLNIRFELISLCLLSIL